VKNGVAERILEVRLCAIVNQVVVDVFVGDIDGERQRVLAVVRLACDHRRTLLLAV